MLKVFVFVPKTHTDQLIEAMAKAGAGVMGNYTHCAFITEGMGNWKSEEGAKPYSGEVGQMSREPENKVEMLCPENKLKEVIEAIKSIHPYESPEIDVVKLTDIGIES